MFETSNDNVVLELVLSKSQAIIVSVMKLYTDKMGKDFHACICRQYVIAIDLKLCIFRNRCQ